MRFPFERYLARRIGAKGPDRENLETEPAPPDTDLAERIVNKSLKMGADESECFIQWGRGMGVTIEGDELKRASGGSTAGFGLRILKKGKVGFSYSNSFDNYESTIDLALKLSRSIIQSGMLPPRCTVESAQCTCARAAGMPGCRI